MSIVFEVYKALTNLGVSTAAEVAANMGASEQGVADILGNNPEAFEYSPVTGAFMAVDGWAEAETVGVANAVSSLAYQARKIGSKALLHRKLQDMKDNYARKAVVHLNEYTDGDTIRVTLDLGCKVFKHESVRLAGINAPELYANSVTGLTTRDWLKAKLLAATEVTVVTHTGSFYDKYGRYLATVYADGVDMNKTMLEAGLATAYNP